MGLYQNLMQMKFMSSIKGELVGEDDFGNKYYQEKMLLNRPQRALKRWVIYKSGQVEASNVPAKWFSWLHYTTEKPLSGKAHAFEKPHQHNMTGSDQAHRPKTSLLKSGQAPKSQAHESWTPEA